MTRLDAGRLDNRPPLFDFGLLMNGERFRRLALPRKKLVLEVGEPRAHPRIGHDIFDCSVELADNVLGVPAGVQSPFHIWV
jgi:hypothetical protein